MTRPATPTEKVALFLLWPVLAPLLVVLIAIIFAIIWPAIPFINVEINEK